MEKTLIEIIEYFGGNGCVRIDAGNGSAGPCWIPVEQIDPEDGAVMMYEHDNSTYAYNTDNSDCQDTLLEAVRSAGVGLDTYPDNNMYASDWLSSAQHPGYQYRFIF
jgi:hypothetical protein